MRIRLKKYLINNKNLAKITVLGFVVTFTRTIINLLISKILAVGLGPAGITLYGQLANYTAILTTASTGANTTGVVKLAAANKGNNSYIEKLIATILLVNLGISTVFLLCSLFAPHYFSRLIFNTSEYATVLRVLGVSVFFGGLNTIYIGLLNGLGFYRLFLWYQMSINVLLLVLVASLVYLLKSVGALYAYLVVQIVAFVFMSGFLYKKKLLEKKFYVVKSFDFSILMSLGAYTIMSFSAVIFVNVSQIVLRSNIIALFNNEIAGIWDSMIKISMAYFAIISSSLGVYFLPKLASRTSRQAINNEVVNVIKLILPLVLLGFIVIYSLRVFLIRILLSDSFLVLADEFSVVLVGDVFKWLGWIFSYVLIARGAVKYFLINEFLAFFSLIALPIIGAKIFGFSGIFMGQTLGLFLYMCSSYMFYRLCLAYESKNEG